MSTRGEGNKEREDSNYSDLYFLRRNSKPIALLIDKRLFLYLVSKRTASLRIFLNTLIMGIDLDVYAIRPNATDILFRRSYLDRHVFVLSLNFLRNQCEFFVWVKNFKTLEINSSLEI